MHLITCSRNQPPSHASCQRSTCEHHHTHQTGAGRCQRTAMALNSGREAGAALSSKWACESRAMYPRNVPPSPLSYPSLFWFLSATMGKSSRPPSMQMQHTRAARGIASKLDDFLKVGMNPSCCVFCFLFQAAWKTHDLAQALALQLNSNLG